MNGGGGPTFGRWLAAAAALTLLVAVAEAYDPRFALGLAAITLLALFLRYPAALGEIRKMLGATPGG